MKELIKELEELLWELKLWSREGEDARDIVIKILEEISDVIEKYKRERRVNNEEDFGDNLL